MNTDDVKVSEAIMEATAGAPVNVGTIDATKLRNLALNAVLQQVDGVVQNSITDPGLQMGVLGLAQALAFRRVLEANGNPGRAHRVRLLKAFMSDLEKKIQKHGHVQQAESDG